MEMINSTYSNRLIEMVDIWQILHSRKNIKSKKAAGLGKIHPDVWERIKHTSSGLLVAFLVAFYGISGHVGLFNSRER